MVNQIFFYTILFSINISSVCALTGFDFSRLTQPANFKVIVKNVGQGSCSILKNQFSGETVIVDAGSSSNAPFGFEERIVEDLGEASVNADFPSSDENLIVVISHTDQDHLNRFHKIFGKNAKLFFRLSRVLLGDHLANYYKSSDAKEFLRTVVGNLRNPAIQAVSLSHDTPITSAIIKADVEDDSLFTDDTYRGYRENFPIEGFLNPIQRDAHHFLEILSMNAGEDTKDLMDENANSAIVRLCINGRNILIMGDATGLTTRRILLKSENRDQLRAALLIASHHGAESGEANSGLWLSFTRPQRVAISAGYRIDYCHPRAEFIQNLMIVNSLTENKDDLLIENEDIHDIALSGDIENIGFYKKSLRSFMTSKGEFTKSTPSGNATAVWLIFETKKALHSTAISGDISYVYNNEGQLVDFYREYG